MIITWFGQSCFEIKDKKKLDNISIVIDPFDESIGLKVPKIKADILIISHSHKDHANKKAIEGNPYVIETAGEYDIKSTMIQGIESFHDENNGKDRGKNIIYRIEINGMSIVHLGDLGHILDSKQVEQLSNVDILLIPVGGKYTIDAKKATEIVSQIEPRIIIPMHYKIDNLNLDIDNVDNFVKAIGLKPTYEDKLKIEKKDLPQEDVELVILQQSS